MKENPLVSIVTPSFNQGRYIAETLESILTQTYENIEHIVIDGGSSDETIRILRKYERYGLKWLSEPDEGQSHAIQKGFERAQGEILGWLNSDDILLPQTINKVVNAFNESKDAGIVYGDVQLISEKGELLGRSKTGELSVHRLLCEDQSVCQPGSFYRKQYMDRIGSVDRSLEFVMDYDLFIRLLRISEGVYLPETLAQFRMHGESKSCNLMPTLGAIEAFRVSRCWGGPLFCKLNFNRVSNLLKGLIKRTLGMPAVNLAKIRSRAGQ